MVNQAHNQLIGKRSLLMVLFAVIAGCVLYASRDYLTLPYIQSVMGSLKYYYTETPFYFIAVYIIFYIVMVTLYIPGPFLMNLLAGAVMGPYVGSIVAVLSTTLGSCTAFYVARYLLQNSVRRWHPNKARTVDRALQREGFFYILFLRVAPALPVGLTNLLMGVTAVSVWVFVAATFLGVAPWIIFYVVTGNQLASIQSLDQLASMEMTLIAVIFMALMVVGHVFRTRSSNLKKT